MLLDNAILYLKILPELYKTAKKSKKENMSKIHLIFKNL